MTSREWGSQFFSFRKSRMIPLRKSFWAMMLGYLEISSVGWRRVSSNRRVSSSKTPTLVEVEPGLMTSVLIGMGTRLLSDETAYSALRPAATTAASAMELTLVWKESDRLVRMAGTRVPVRMQPFLQSAVWTRVL